MAALTDRDSAFINAWNTESPRAGVLMEQLQDNPVVKKYLETHNPATAGTKSLPGGIAIEATPGAISLTDLSAEAHPKYTALVKDISAKNDGGTRLNKDAILGHTEEVLPHFAGKKNAVDAFVIGIDGTEKTPSFLNEHFDKINELKAASHITADQANVMRNNVRAQAVAAKETAGQVGQQITKEMETIASHADLKITHTSPAATAAAAAGSTGAIPMIGKKGYVGELEYSKLKGKPVQRLMRDISSNAQHSWGGLAKVTAGTGAVIYFGLDALKTAGNMMSGVPDKQADASWGKLAIDAAGIAGGITLARWNGMKAAAGSNYSLGA